MGDDKNFARCLLNYINESPTAYHAVGNGAELLRQNGFKEIKEQEEWRLKAGGKYFLTKNRSAMIAFTVGHAGLEDRGFRIIGTHTDSPNFKVKPGDSITTADGYVMLNVEVYGGVILSTWFDRPLSLAGRVMVKTQGTVTDRYVNLHRPLFIIPNLCIHFQRDVNENCSYNKHTQVLPLMWMEKDSKEKGLSLLGLLEKELCVEGKDIVDYELSLYEYADGILMGADEEFISASRIDNLSMVYSALCGLIDAQDTCNTKVFAAFDNEEVGSTSAAGANSLFLLTTLNRICKNLGLDEEGCFRAIANSTSISADTAHAVHPNYSDKHDSKNRPVLGGGPVIKYSANQKYATTAVSASYFMEACESANVPYQKFVMRNDMAGGSTIGPATSSLTTIPTVDVGTPILAMHSVREFGCVADNVCSKRVFTTYYEQ